MAERNQMSIGQLTLGLGSKTIRVVVCGAITTRATALAKDPTAPIGSLYVCDDRLYQRTARTAGDATETDLTKVTQSAAD